MDRLPSTVSPELRLLLWCARPAGDRAVPPPLLTEQSRAALNWDTLLRLAHHHRLAPLLYRHLSAAHDASVPAPVLKQLEGAFRRNARRNMFLTSRLLALLDLFADHNILAVPFKGPVLAETVYRNLAFRAAGDLDIVMHQSHANRARDLLFAQGYHLHNMPSQPIQKLILKYQHHYCLVTHRLSVEIHWAFAGYIRAIPITFDDIVPHLSTTMLGGRPVPAVPPEHLLVLLCVHGIRHYWERLTWVSDMAWLLATTPALDWDQVLACSHQFNIRRVVRLGLFLAHHLCGGELPPDVLHAIASDRELLVLASRVEERLFSAQSKPVGKNRDVLYVMARERLQDKLTYVWRQLHWTLIAATLPNERDFAFVSLPGWLSPLYYLVRPVRIVRDRHRLLSGYLDD